MAEAGAPHGTLLLAESQTAGKGRGERRWITNPGTAIAMSLIVRDLDLESEQWLRLFGWGALSITQALKKLGLDVEIKWPNDVLLADKKIAGILINSRWIGEKVDYLVLGIGVNVTSESVPEQVDFPATSVADVLGKPIDREDLLISILSSLETLLGEIVSDSFLEQWRGKLAYRNRDVVINTPTGEISGKITGLSPEGELILTNDDGSELKIGYGELSLRPRS